MTSALKIAGIATAAVLMTGLAAIIAPILIAQRETKTWLRQQ